VAYPLGAQAAPRMPLAGPLPVRAVAPWAVFLAVLAAVLLYFVGAEQGALSVFSGESVHEWVHDSRHLLGYPCH
jgi:hypothetical protein